MSGTRSGWIPQSLGHKIQQLYLAGKLRKEIITIPIYPSTIACCTSNELKDIFQYVSMQLLRSDSLLRLYMTPNLHQSPALHFPPREHVGWHDIRFGSERQVVEA